MFEALQEIDSVRLNFSDDGRLLLNLTIAFIMFGVALELDPGDFKLLRRNPRPVITGIVSQFFLMPLFTFLFALSLREYITPTVGLGMILVAACPGGNISNCISALAKGNIALSVSLTAFTSIGGLILTPFNFALWGNLFMKYYTNPASQELVRPISIDLWSVLQTIIMILGIPLLIGILFRHYFPKTTNKIIVSIKRLSIGAFAAIVIVIFTKNYEHFINHIWYVFILVLFHNALALTAGYQFGRMLRLDRRDKRTISIETGIQNSGLALALLFDPKIFPSDIAIGGMAFIAAWWGVWHIIAGLTIAGVWSGFSLSPQSPPTDLEEPSSTN